MSNLEIAEKLRAQINMKTLILILTSILLVACAPIEKKCPDQINLPAIVIAEQETTDTHWGNIVLKDSKGNLITLSLYCGLGGAFSASYSAGDTIK